MDLESLTVAPSRREAQLELAQLAETAYAELRRLARGYLNRERADHTLQPTALVNEAYLRLADQKVQWHNRAHFVGTAALLMRRILREHARGHAALRRGGGAAKLMLEDTHAITAGTKVEFSALEEALDKLT